MGDLHDKTTKMWSLAMSGIQIVTVIVVITGAFFTLKNDVAEIDQKVSSQGRDLDRVIDYLGIWAPKARGQSQ